MQLDQDHTESFFKELEVVSAVYKNFKKTIDIFQFLVCYDCNNKEYR